MSKQKQTAGDALPAFVHSELSRRACPSHAAGAQAYMKSAMPYHGVRAEGVRAVARAALDFIPFDSASNWRESIQRLWRGATHREERYVAIEILKAGRYRSFIDLDALPLMREMISDGAWWDFVDAVATRPLGELLAKHPKEMRPELLKWSRGDDIWLRRAAILAQLNFGERTDRALLERLIAPSLDSRAFFLAKAIGWALRHFARTDPAWVRDFVKRHRAQMAPLSIREALRHIGAVRGATGKGSRS